MDLRTKICVISAAVIVVTCIILACFSAFAHAANVTGTTIPFDIDKDFITATVAEDGTFTLDTCKLTNESTEKYTIEKSSVSIAQDATDIEGLDQTNLTINGFGDGKTVFEGKPGDSSEFTPTDLEDLASGASTILTFAIDLPDDVDIETLLDKQVFTISLTPKQVATWIPMQAEIANGTKIDFYPAFSDKNQIAGYKFATYDGTNYHEIENITSMSDIYSALQPTPVTPGTGTTTLYYQKTSPAAQALKCYTVKDLNWNYVFGTTIEEGEAIKYDQRFSDGYQKDKSGNANGIKTALLASDGFGSKWNQQTNFPELVNNVKYIDQKGTDPSANGGFYGCYGGAGGGLLSNYSSSPWGCCVSNNVMNAFYFRVDLGGWYPSYRVNVFGVVLARAFN